MAAIDCGTNSVRLLIADAGPDGSLVDVTRQMRIVRLGEGVDRTGRLAEAAIERTRVALVDYAAEIAAAGVARARMVATSASRDASNAEDFRAMVTATLGFAPEVVSGDEEARLTFAGAVQGLRARAPFLVFDIGGGSTEFVVGSQDGVDAAISVDIGCVRLTERHLHDHPPTPAQVAAAERDITTEVDRALAAVDAGRARTLVGLAGSVTTVTALALGLTEYDAGRIHRATVSTADVAKVTADLLAATPEQRLANAVMHPGRADVIGAGALILRIILERSGAEAVVASEADILDGVAMSCLRQS
ncbi:Ppx/GppA phosphatase family protein [Dactylosporangium aurantiacum]|uniref:Ppx/GppA phosphatase family protein n=1 Tax=Dactylosporangium aurantiacum TaxID=35754 RepID=UPI000524F1F5|nr:Ppx/GppA phosphatase family protein [Dactylosporangium aurantiacum]MDG6105422.1 Ppx/GppA phosphatase family protein [Dactylosporangium aurantiacum]